MTKLNDLTTSQIQWIIDIKKRIETLQNQLDSIAGDETPATVEARAPAKRKYHLTAAHRRKLVKALAKARAVRWSRIKGNREAKASKPTKKRKMFSAAARARLAAAARVRWAKAKAAGKTTL